MKKLLAVLLAVLMVVSMVGCTPKDTVEQSEVQKIIAEAQNMTLEELAKKAIASNEYQLIILDEINIAIAMNMIKVSDVKDALLNKPETLEIVLTGRYAHPELKALAHLVTEMKPIKHYFDIGVMARQGIEY